MCLKTIRRKTRSGPVRQMRSDRGTNFIGAERELKSALEEMDHKRLQEISSKEFNADWLINWSRNPPAASHMGGVWERQIRTVRSILSSLLRDYGHALNDESLRTLMIEVECIVNSRPLTFPSGDATDLQPLTPNHILTMKSKVVMPPPGDFQKDDVYLRKRWRRVQYMANIFWTRWKREYLQTLQARTKWNQPKRNIEIGDIVLIKDENTARNDWPMARVFNVRQDSKKLVRSATLKLSCSTQERPIDKLVLLKENDQTSDGQNIK